MVEEVSSRFVDAEAYQGKRDEKLTFKMIVLEHLQRILRLSSVEFRGGYWQEKSVSKGGVVSTEKTYVPDSREEYGNAVDSLHDILFPHFDTIAKEEILLVDEELDKVFEEHTKTVNGRIEWNDEENFKKAKIMRVTRRLFRALNTFLFREHYLESRMYTEDGRRAIDETEE